MDLNTPPERDAWDRHWSRLTTSGSLFGAIASTVRRQILSRAVGWYARRHLQRPGWSAELGCGTSESSSRIATGEARLLGLDFSVPALQLARRTGRFAGLALGDIRRLPIRDGGLAGIWNLGVLEHFPEPEGVAILKEFRRVLAPGACAVLFWPPEFGASRLVLGPFEWLRSRLSGRPFAFFPDEVNRLRSRAHARRLLAQSGLEEVTIDFSPRDFFIHLVVVGRRPER